MGDERGRFLCDLYKRSACRQSLRFIPNAFSRRASELASYEYLAIVNGRPRGWLTREDTLQ